MTEIYNKLVDLFNEQIKNLNPDDLSNRQSNADLRSVKVETN